MFSTKSVIILLFAAFNVASASVALPGIQATSIASLQARPAYSPKQTSGINFFVNHNDRIPLAMAIPGYGIGEQIFVGGFSNFLQIYNFIITGRILLSWFPQAQGISALQPVFQITDPYLNLFRGIIPPIFGLDLSPILAFFTLNVLTSSTAAIGMEIPEGFDKKNNKFQQLVSKGKVMLK
jgi:YggT family protein